MRRQTMTLSGSPARFEAGPPPTIVKPVEQTSRQAPAAAPNAYSGRRRERKRQRRPVSREHRTGRESGAVGTLNLGGMDVLAVLACAPVRTVRRSCSRSHLSDARERRRVRREGREGRWQYWFERERPFIHLGLLVDESKPGCAQLV